MSEQVAPAEAPEEKKEWTPRTTLGQLVKEGKITSLMEIFQLGYKIKEPEIVQTLLPNLKTLLYGVRVVQKQTDAGEKTRFRAVVAIGDQSGWFGVGHAKSMNTRTAIDKAIRNAMLNIVPVPLGCGSWECRCGQPHSVPYVLSGKTGSVGIIIYPAPRGLGIVAAPHIKNLISLAGVKDAWTKTFGMTSTDISMAFAVYDAFKNASKMILK
jgi:small subunit ribosomal protein S5